MKNVLIISHERSGTHFLINTISINWHRFKREQWIDFPQSKGISYEWLESLPKRKRVYKTHHTYDALMDVWPLILKKFHVFYVIRDGRDVMVSCYHHFTKQCMIPSITFSEFLRFKPCNLKQNWYDISYADNMVQRWARHVDGWSDKGVNIISFEDLKNDFEQVIHKIERVLNVESNTVIQPKLTDRCVNPRKGIIGDWRNHFNDDDVRFYESTLRQMQETISKN